MLDTRMRSSRNPFLRYPIRVYQSDRASPTDTLTTDSPGKQRGAVGVAPRRRLTLPLDKLHYISGEDVVVPEYRLTRMNDLIEGTPGHEEPLYRLPVGPIGPSTLMGTLLGLGRAALDFVIENCASKAVTHTVYTRQSDSVAVQTQIAEAALKIDTARLHSIAIVNKLDAAANTSGTIDDAARAWMRASSGYAVQQVLDAIQLLLSVHGSAAFAESSPLQRIWRDANVAGRHAGLNAAVGYEVLGKTLLAIPEQITPMV